MQNNKNLYWENTVGWSDFEPFNLMLNNHLSFVKFPSFETNY